jgi:hypothetical protein
MGKETSETTNTDNFNATMRHIGNPHSPCGSFAPLTALLITHLKQRREARNTAKAAAELPKPAVASLSAR